jgi:hypothetical protein
MNALVAKLIRHDWFIRMSSRHSEVVPDLAAGPTEGHASWACFDATISRACRVIRYCGAQRTARQKRSPEHANWPNEPDRQHGVAHRVPVLG